MRIAAHRITWVLLGLLGLAVVVLWSVRLA
jgi:hypothetical protein